MNNAQVRIIGAFLAGLAMVAGAFFIERPTTEPAVVDETGGVTLSERKHIPISDTDADGRPDWEQNLTIVNAASTEDASSTDTYTPPDTVGGQLGLQLFGELVTLQKMGMYEEVEDEFIGLAVDELERLTAAPTFSVDDLKNTAEVTNETALRTYGNLVAGTIFFYQTDDENEFQVFQRMAVDGNPKHLEKLAIIEQQYTDIINALLELEVPQSYTFEHLAIVNSFSELRQDVAAMQLFFKDPLYTSARYSRFTADVLGMNQAIFSLYDALYLDEQISFGENDALPILVELLQ